MKKKSLIITSVVLVVLCIASLILSINSGRNLYHYIATFVFGMAFAFGLLMLELWNDNQEE